MVDEEEGVDARCRRGADGAREGDHHGLIPHLEGEIGVGEELLPGKDTLVPIHKGEGEGGGG